MSFWNGIVTRFARKESRKSLDGLMAQAMNKPGARERMEMFRMIIEQSVNREASSRLTADDIASLPDNELSFAVLDRVDAKALETGLHPAKVFKEMPPGYEIVLSVWWLDLEVSNGGFNQFFFNKGLEMGRVALRSLERIGADGYLDVVRKAIDCESRQGKHVSVGHDGDRTRQALPRPLNKKLKKFDDLFSQIRADPRQRLNPLLTNYIRNHPEEFIIEE